MDSMALFDELGKKITQTRYEAVNKVKVISEVSKLKGLLENEQQLLQGYFTALGQKYVETYEEPTDDVFAQLYTSIKHSRAQMDAWEEDIERIKVSKTCPTCGEACQQDSLFCISCGTNLVTVDEIKSTVMLCTQCGVELNETAKFCTKCGQKVEK
jgi:hypothetical protein